MVILTVDMGRSTIKLSISNTVMGMGTDTGTVMETGMETAAAIIKSESHRFE